jgi:N-acyl-D-aspartate/D-glutamate deacylase
MLEIARQSGVAIHFAHIKVLGKDVWGESDRVVKMISEAQAEGLRVTADQYPWIASSTQLKNAILSAEWLAGTRSAWRERLQDPANEGAVLEDLQQGIARRGGGERLMLVSTGDQSIEGLMLSDVAKRWGVSPELAALKLLREAPPRVVSFNMSESDVENFMAQPWVATSSDGTDGHPRKYASFPRKYARYVVERQVLSLEAFVERSAALPARILGLIDRGIIASGNIADVIVFDPRRYKDTATFEQWDRLTPGLEWMFINGQPVIEHGRYPGALAGQNLALPAESGRVE